MDRKSMIPHIFLKNSRKFIVTGYVVAVFWLTASTVNAFYMLTSPVPQPQALESAPVKAANFNIPIAASVLV